MRRYQMTDCAVFALLLCLLEGASAWALGFFPGEAYVFSPVLFIALLMMARWGGAGLGYAVLGGALHCLLHGGAPIQYAVYMLGNMAVAVCFLWIKFAGVARLRASSGLVSLYCVSGALAICLGRALVSALLGQGWWLGRFLVAEALGTVVTCVVFLIARRQNGLFEPQRDYLERIKREEEGQKAWNSN